MRKLILWNLMTLDGYFDGKTPWDLAFHGLAWGPELEKYCQNLGQEGDLLVFGRKTFEGMASYWPTTTETPEIAAYMNGIAKICVSRTLKSVSWNNSRVVADPVAELKALKAEGDKAIFIFGSAELASALTDAGLIDEYRICLVPVVLGGGSPLFKPAKEKMPLKLLGAKTLQTGGVILRYEPVKGNV